MQNSISKKPIWIGELRTSRGITVVIHDSQLPEASYGRIYLYNTDRNAIVEYVDEIVKPNLYDIDESAVRDAECKFSERWKATRNEFMEKHKALLELDNTKNTPPAKKPKAEPSPEPELAEDSDGYSNDYDDDDWADGYDD